MLDHVLGVSSKIHVYMYMCLMIITDRCMCIEREFECDMQAYGSCDKVLMREMRMEILIVVSVLTCGVIVHLCTCAFSVVMSMQCVHAHVGVEYILLSLVALHHSMYVCVCVHAILYSHLNLLAAGHELLEEV